MLSDTLSARSYLELSHELAQERENPQNLRDSLSETPPEISENLGPCFPQRERGSRAKSDKTDTVPERDPPPPLADRPVRKRGRPRLETAKDAAAIEERRMQIRRAQRTYRQKKETTIQTLRSRVESLEQTLQNISGLLDTTDGSEDSGLGSSHDHAHTKQLILAEINKARSFSGKNTDSETFRDIFGYHVSRNKHEVDGSDQRKHHAYQRARSPSPLLNRLFPTTTIYTYSNQESDLSRRLQRFCLEHTYRWLIDPRSDPLQISRIFGLVPCIHDMPGICRSFRRILHSEIGSPLEEVTKQAFYTLGGAGTHFPRSTEDGEPIYPKNIRRPGKILRRMARILRRGGIRDWDEDWSGNAEPESDEELQAAEKSMSQRDRLRALDLEGDWFDCHDVQGYLEQQGIVIGSSSLWLDVPSETVGTLHGLSPTASISHLYASSSEGTPSDQGGSTSNDINQSTYVFDVECFFELLLTNLRILGRAPGFRLYDVETAVRTSIHRRSSS
ncbi:uncharacterized protein N7483_007030 [Penicillium malachiteum]|uniref:uncharacterized protein n=1 Tax=Penicillium malachiteum TaxID=1324776 RepID=UPI002549B977|nr:uncharacterized protein N7483_007030 [Penicillium malachiteum]KAJ5725673.1 hypothetical protein N7483_007030 [Penicillium malachiteum]